MARSRRQDSLRVGAPSPWLVIDSPFKLHLQNTYLNVKLKNFKTAAIEHPVSECGALCNCGDSVAVKPALLTGHMPGNKL